VAISLSFPARKLAEIRKQQGSGEIKMRMTRFQTLFLVLSFLAVTAWMMTATAPTAQAATTNARIQGTVSDPQAAVVAKAKITATNEATGVKYETVSNADGAYLFSQLPIGSYSIDVTSPGFKSFHASGIVLKIDQEYVEPVKLTVGSTTEVIEVAASSIQVDTTDMQFNNIVDGQQMADLPLIGRNFANLQTTLPGVQATSGGERISGSSVSGSQQTQSAFSINGADTNDIALNTQVLSPILDALSQFNLIDGPMNAEYSRNSGGIVSASIKSGTNQYHGNAFEFYRDTFLNTNNFFQKPVDGSYKAPSPYHQHIYGGTFGGPILKNKLFIFGAFQATPSSAPQSGEGSATVFSSDQLAGDFSASADAFTSNPIPSTISIPGCTAGETWAECLGAEGLNGQVPTSAFNSISKTLLDFVPPANNGTSGYLFNATEVSKSYQEDGRVDFNPNAKNQFSFIGLYDFFNAKSTIPFTGATLPGFGDQDVEHIQQYTFDYVHTFGSSAVNDFGAHWTRFNFQSSVPQQVVDPGSVGFSITPQDTAAATIPKISVTGYFDLGGSNNGPQPRIDQNYQIEDNFSKVAGHHALKFGYDGRRFNVSQIFDSANSGSFSFGGDSATYGSGDAGLDFLLGIPASYAQAAGSVIQASAFMNYFYAQDTWKASDTITLSYGLGYSIDTPLINHQYGGIGVSCYIIGEQSTVFPTAPEGLVFPGDPGCTNTSQARTRYTEFGPRVGFAWAPDLGKISGGPGKLSIRGGFGIYYNRTEEESALQTLSTPPFGLNTSGAADFGGSPAFANPYSDIDGGGSESNPFPYARPTAGSSAVFHTPLYNCCSTFGKDFRAPYAENFQLSIERELPSKVIARVSYVGSLGRHNQSTYEGNPETEAGHTACVQDPTCYLSPYRNYQAYYHPENKLAGVYTGILEAGVVGSGASSNYNGLQVSLTKGETHGLSFQVSYTYSHSLDTGSSFENMSFGNYGERGYNQWQPWRNYGDSSFDARQRLVISPNYTVPTIKKGGSSLSPINLLLAGWQVSGIMSMATGFPYDISYGGWYTSRSLYCDASIDFYACPDAPDQVAPLVRVDPRVRDDNGYGTWFDSSSFAPSAVGTFGTTRRNPYHGPGINNTNMVLAKNFSLGRETARSLQIRMESDNVFNHTQFSLPDGLFVDGTFGQITGAASARRTQLAAKITF